MCYLSKWTSLILSMVVMWSTASAAEAPLKIRSVFDINGAFCAIRTNGVLGLDNRDSAASGRGGWTLTDNLWKVAVHHAPKLRVPLINEDKRVSRPAGFKRHVSISVN